MAAVHSASAAWAGAAPGSRSRSSSATCRPAVSSRPSSVSMLISTIRAAVVSDADNCSARAMARASTAAGSAARMSPRARVQRAYRTRDRARSSAAPNRSLSSISSSSSACSRW
ncbi:hypothetical protein SFUMM280S_09285 [Streptomyces fumanus]